MKVITKCIILAVLLSATNTCIAYDAFENDTLYGYVQKTNTYDKVDFVLAIKDNVRNGEYINPSISVDTHDKVDIVLASKDDIHNAMFIILGLIVFLMFVVIVLAFQFCEPVKKSKW